MKTAYVYCCLYINGMKYFYSIDFRGKPSWTTQFSDAEQFKTKDEITSIPLAFRKKAHQGSLKGMVAISGNFLPTAIVGPKP